MFNWMSKKGKNVWMLMFFLFSFTMLPVIPAIYIMSSLPHPYGVVGFLYEAIVFFGLFFLWDKFYFKSKEKHIQKEL